MSPTNCCDKALLLENHRGRFSPARTVPGGLPTDTGLIHQKSCRVATAFNFIFLLDPGTRYYVPLLNCTSVCTSFLRFLFKFYKYLFDSNFYILWISSINRLFQYSVLTLYSIIRSTVFITWIYPSNPSKYSSYQIFRIFIYPVSLLRPQINHSTFFSTRIFLYSFLYILMSISLCNNIVWTLIRNNPKIHFSIGLNHLPDVRSVDLLTSFFFLSGPEDTSD